MTDRQHGDHNFVTLPPDLLASRLARGADEELLAERMVLAVQEELGRPFTPAELARARASAAGLVRDFERYARMPEDQQRELAEEHRQHDGSEDEEGA